MLGNVGSKEDLIGMQIYTEYRLIEFCKADRYVKINFARHQHDTERTQNRLLAIIDLCNIAGCTCSSTMNSSETLVKTGFGDIGGRSLLTPFTPPSPRWG